MEVPRGRLDFTDALLRDLWIFDIGGTLLKSMVNPVAFDDALRLYRLLGECGKTLALLTNICFQSVREVTEVMNRTGFKIAQDHVFTASSVTAEYIRSKNPEARCFAIADGALQEELVSHGLTVAVNPPVEFVIVGVDRGATLRELSFAAKLVQEGATLLYIDQGPMCMTKYHGAEDMIIGPKCLAAAIEYATGIGAEAVCKPSPEPFLQVAKKTSHSPEDAVMVGNLLETDVAGANAAGMMSLLVDRPEASSVNEPYSGLIIPDLTVGSLEEFIEPLQRMSGRRR